jgi:hypothetical protein
LETIIIIGKYDISHPYCKCHPKHLAPKLLGVVVFPLGIENGSKYKEKQHLTDAPNHPFGRQGMILENQTNGNESNKVNTYAER